MGLVAARHSAQAIGEAGVITSPHLRPVLGHGPTMKHLRGNGSLPLETFCGR